MVTDLTSSSRYKEMVPESYRIVERIGGVGIGDSVERRRCHKRRSPNVAQIIGTYRIRQRRAGRGGPVRAGVAAEIGTVLAIRGRLPAQYGRGGELLDPAEPPVHSGLSFHDLRHTHKTMLIELGVPEVFQDERLGHHPPGMRSVYAHTTRRMREELVDGLQGLRSAGSPAMTEPGTPAQAARGP